jgi:plastocyanin
VDATLRPIVGRLLRSAVALVMVVVLAGCAGSAATRADTAAVSTSTIDLPKSYKFVPAAISVLAGTTVTWTNHDDFTHNVTLTDGSPPLALPPGSSATHTFATAGLYPYLCSLHPRDMKGSVVVTGG